MDVCEFHKEMIEARTQMQKRQTDQDLAVEAKIAKSSIKWLAMIFALPAIFAALGLYAFVQSADYRYGTLQQALLNASNIKLLDERTLGIKTDMLKVQADIAIDLVAIKSDLRDISREIRGLSVDRNKP
jgi:hypothetical protein